MDQSLIKLFIIPASGMHCPVCGMVHKKELLLRVAHQVTATGFYPCV